MSVQENTSQNSNKMEDFLDKDLSEITGLDIVDIYGELYPGIDWKAAYRLFGSLCDNSDALSLEVYYNTLELNELFSFFRRNGVSGLSSMTKKKFIELAQEVDLITFAKLSIRCNLQAVLN